ncbi:ATPase, T2SS/T4P/T4SS family [Clostridium gasigenes]|uniref:CpaF family protein n=1 Tax=Clostridium gasigenes TaxID=94869 RepID=A0A7X0SFK8_9CLOT|nr:ATPase, T2SS/T4P/T4SS family [Clostridium gasigenes]MBB6716650.1 CpaF family protein [Clostridium gasigenes]
MGTLLFGKKNKKDEKKIADKEISVIDIVHAMRNEPSEIMIEEESIEYDNKIIDYNNLIDIILDEFIVNRPNLINAVERGVRSKEELTREIFMFLKLQEVVLNKEELAELMSRFETYVWGYGILQELIDNPDISDIKTIDYNNIRIKVKGVRKNSDVKFADRESLKKYINYIAIKNNSILSEINAIQKFTDKESSKDFILRINISSEFINSNGLPCLIIRKIPKNKYDISDLRKLGMFNEEIENYLQEAMSSGLSIFSTGKGASGKTTLINALMDEIPDDKACLVIQEAEELFTGKHPDMIFQKVKFAKGDGNIEYTLRDLSINGLLMDLDYFIIGEIKGAEAYDMANAIYTGHAGIASVHGNSAEEAVNKIVHYMKYVSDMKKGELLEMLSNIDIIIFMKDFKIMEIAEVSGFNYEMQTLEFNRVFQYEITKKNNGYIGEFKLINSSCEKIEKKKLYSKYNKSINL